MRATSILLLSLLCAACTHGPSRPDWLDAPSVAYPASRYLTGRGQAENAGLARDRARADLAKVFEVAVRESSSDQVYWQQGAGGRDGLKTLVSRDISLQTSQVINGIEIARTWQSPTGGDYHALAVLERLPASNRLRHEIDGLDAETAENIERAGNESALPGKISAAYNALRAQLERRHPQRMLQVVDPTGQGIPSRYPLARLESDFNLLLERWQIGLVVAQDDLGGLTDMLAGALGNAGIRHLSDTTAADYQLKAELETEKLTTPDGWIWRRGALRIFLLETAGGNLIGSHQWPYKSSARQADMVDIRARAQLAELLTRDLLTVLVGFGEVALKKESGL